MADDRASLLPAGSRARGLERLPIRTRESAMTLSAWCLSISADEGEGSIARLEGAASAPRFRGQGIVLGWDQARVAEASEALVPREDSPAFETQQLGLEGYWKKDAGVASGKVPSALRVTSARGHLRRHRSSTMRRHRRRRALLHPTPRRSERHPTPLAFLALSPRAWMFTPQETAQ